MATHDVKSWPEFFGPIESGAKPFDLRRNDRHYRVKDIIRLHEYDDRTNKMSGRIAVRVITYVLEGVGPGAITPLQGLSRGFAILGLGEVKE